MIRYEYNGELPDKEGEKERCWGKHDQSTLYIYQDNIMKH
jgi:hypothetical protein